MNVFGALKEIAKRTTVQAWQGTCLVYDAQREDYILQPPVDTDRVWDENGYFSYFLEAYVFDTNAQNHLQMLQQLQADVQAIQKLDYFMPRQQAQHVGYKRLDSDLSRFIYLTQTVNNIRDGLALLKPAYSDDTPESDAIRAIIVHFQGLYQAAWATFAQTLPQYKKAVPTLTNNYDLSTLDGQHRYLAAEQYYERERTAYAVLCRHLAQLSGCEANCAQYIYQQVPQLCAVLPEISRPEAFQPISIGEIDGQEVRVQAHLVSTLRYFNYFVRKNDEDILLFRLQRAYQRPQNKPLQVEGTPRVCLPEDAEAATRKMVIINVDPLQFDIEKIPEGCQGLVAKLLRVLSVQTASEPIAYPVPRVMLESFDLHGVALVDGIKTHLPVMLPLNVDAAKYKAPLRFSEPVPCLSDLALSVPIKPRPIRFELT